MFRGKCYYKAYSDDCLSVYEMNASLHNTQTHVLPFIKKRKTRKNELMIYIFIENILIEVGTFENL